jgi:hypothetical protein
MNQPSADQDQDSGDARWLAPVERLLARAIAETKLLGVATPLGAEEERARLVAAIDAGRRPAPRWTYAPMPEADALRRALDDAANALARIASPLALAYAARARELALEVELAGAVGTEAIGPLARRRFAASSAREAAAAADLAREWAAEPIDAESTGNDAPRLTTDAADPRSLLSRMREEIGRARIPFRVVVQPGLAPLAATGERTIWIAAGRLVSAEEIERTVLHEIEAHACPRARALHLAPSLFSLGTARGSDDQEGLALLLEERHGFLRGARRRELALRHRVVEHMDAGATFVDVVTTLRAEGLPARRAILVAERAFRGGTATLPGLGRERVYLPSYLAVAAHLRTHPADERILTSGQVSVDALNVLAPFLD